MKRMILAATLLVFVIGLAVSASAATIKATGQWAEEAVVSDNFDMSDATNKAEEDFNIYTRIRTQFEFIANENLKGVLATEIGTEKWGKGALEFGASAVGIEVRRAYLDFTLPGTKIRTTAGHQGLSLPYALGNGNLILDEEVASIATSIPIIDELSVTLGYARLYDTDNATKSGTFDAAFLAVPVKLNGVEFAPYFMYGYAGAGAVGGVLGGTDWNTIQRKSVFYGLTTVNGTTAARSAWWAGSSFKMNAFDPIVVMADFAYGTTGTGSDRDDRSGWMFDLAVDYTGFDFMTPEVFFVYTSGENGNSTDNNGKSERMPMLKASNWGFGKFFYGLDDMGMGAGNINGGGTDPRQLGFWALGLSLKDITFIEKLKHTLTFQYIQGTNDKDYIQHQNADATFTGAGGRYLSSNLYGLTLTEKDSLFEIDLVNKYNIYDELTAYLDLGWINNNYSKSVWGTNAANRSDAYKAALGLLYSF